MDQLKCLRFVKECFYWLGRGAFFLVIFCAASVDKRLALLMIISRAALYMIDLCWGRSCILLTLLEENDPGGDDE